MSGHGDSSCGYAVNCFSAAVFMGLKGLGVEMPPDVAKNFDPLLQHEKMSWEHEDIDVHWHERTLARCGVSVYSDNLAL